MPNSYTPQTWIDNDPTKPVSAARMTYLEGQYAAAMADAAALYEPVGLSAATLAALGTPLVTVPSILSGATLTIYGHSYTPAPGFYCTPGKEWPTVLAGRFGMNQVNWGESGARMIETAVAAIGTKFPGSTNTANRSYVAGTPGVVVIESEQNDVILGPFTAAAQSGFTHALRALIATVCAGQRIESSTATAVGTWTTFASPQASNGDMRYSSTASASMEFLNVSAPTGKVYVLTIANSGATDAGVFDVLVDGVSQGIAYAGSSQSAAFTSGAAGSTAYTFGPAVVSVNVPKSGTHSVKVVKTDATAQPIWVDALLVPSLTPPEVVICLDPPINYPPALQSVASNWSTYSPVYNPLVKSVVAEFGRNVSWVDLAPGWNSNTMAATNDANHFHPNDAGMALIESNVRPAVTAGVLKMVAPGIR